MTFQTHRSILSPEANMTMNRESMMNAHAPRPAAPSVLVQIELLSKQCDLLRDEVGGMNDALGAILRPEESCEPQPFATAQSVSPVQNRLIELTRRIEESAMMLRDLRRRIDL